MPEDPIVIPRWALDKLLRNYRRALRAEGLTTDNCETLMTLLLNEIDERDVGVRRLAEKLGTSKSTAWRRAQELDDEVSELKALRETILGQKWDTCGTENGGSDESKHFRETEMKRQRNGFETLARAKEPSSESTKTRKSSTNSVLQKKENPPLGGKRKKSFQPPAVAEARAFFLEQNAPPFEADKWHDHFTANGWKVSGRAPMKDWKASARNWIRNIPQFSRGEPPSTPLATRSVPTKPDPPRDSFSSEFMESEMEYFGLEQKHFEEHDTNKGQRWTLTNEGLKAKRQRQKEISAS